MSNPASTNWETTTLDSLQRAGLIECINGYSSGVHNQDGDGIPHIRPFNISPLGHSSVEQLKYIPAERHKETHSLQVRDVIFNNTNTEELVGKTAIWRHAGLFGFSNHMTRIRVKKFKEINPEFLAFYLHYHWQTGMSRQLCRRHVSQASIMGDRFFQIPVPKPSEIEQSKIAHVLTKIQQAIETETNITRVSRKLKAAVMKKLFTEGLEGEPQKETDIGMVPKSWDLLPLGEYCEVENSSISYTDFSSHVQDDSSGRSVQAMGVKVSDMNLPGNEKYFITANLFRTISLELAQRKLVPERTVIFPKRGAAIATNKKRLTTAWTVLDPNLIGVRPIKRLDPEFLFYWFENFDLRTITEPGPTPQLNKKNLVPLKIAAPQQLEEQKDIATIISKLDSSVSQHSQKADRLTELFNEVLRLLMSGELSVADLELAPSICHELEGVAA